MTQQFKLPPLPTWNEAERNCLRNNETPLDRFIFDNEPSVCDAEWRQQLTAVLHAAIALDRQGRGEPVQALLHQARRVRNYSDPEQVFEAVPVSAFGSESDEEGMTIVGDGAAQLGRLLEEQHKGRGRFTPQPTDPDVLPGEAIFGFAAWLTSLKTPVTFSECHGAAIGADLAAAYNASQGFDQAREDYHKRLKPYPKDEPSQPTEPVKVPSDADLFAIHNEYFPAMALGHDNYLSFARALLARYGSKS
ncbi:hypothetical protein RE432_18495 [Pusillimonas sp. SM2304]|uniref:hypothetical protein n=1 Tax=Pusillimonas sp. SM2304 TaxID=3073241 RepID=UPI002876A5C8|nr:hypothetical protein [Pusillimonas sp. SM2304]MDS1142428.1 hypothetical protein [Pusillimonas sp. SM2304]